jgi:hypothetical protein
VLSCVYVAALRLADLLSKESYRLRKNQETEKVAKAQKRAVEPWVDELYNIVKYFSDWCFIVYVYIPRIWNLVVVTLISRTVAMFVMFSNMSVIVFMIGLSSIFLIYRVSLEEWSVFWEVIVSVILSRKVYTNMCPIPSGFQSYFTVTKNKPCEKAGDDGYALILKLIISQNHILVSLVIF